MIPSQKAIDLIKSFEGFRDTAYQDTGKVWTVGFGTISYKDGTAVKKGDTITESQAVEELMFDVTNDAKRIPDLNLNQNQQDAVISFVYNVGLQAFNKSTLKKKIVINPHDQAIRNEFMKWVKDNGKTIQGLVNRRKQESDLYFS